MNTDASYGVGANYATLSKPLTQKGNFSPSTPFPADNRPISFGRICESQNRLLALVDQFAGRGNYAPLHAAHDLLHYWLSTPVETLAVQADKDQFHAVLLLIDSLGEVYPITNLPTQDGQGRTVEPIGLLEKYTARLSPGLDGFRCAFTG